MDVLKLSPFSSSLDSSCKKVIAIEAFNESGLNRVIAVVCRKIATRLGFPNFASPRRAFPGLKSFTYLSPHVLCRFWRLFYVFFLPLAFCEMIGLLEEERTARIVKKVFTRRYPHREETYTYERYYLDVPAEYHWIRPFFNQKNYDINVKERGNGLEIICSPRKKASAKKDRQQQKTRPKHSPNFNGRTTRLFSVL